MDEQNFDKFFGDHLKADEDFPFTDNKWDKMQTHLNTHLAAKRRWRLGAWLSVPLLALLGTLGFMGWSLHNSQQDIRDLTAEIKTLRLEKQASLPLSPQESLQTVSTVKSDTVYHHVVVRRYDTIFQTVVRRDLSDTRSTKSDASFSKINTTILPETKATTTQNNIATDTKPKTQNVTLKDPTLKAEKQENDAVKTTPINKESTDAKSETQNAKLEDPLSKKAEKQENDAVKTTPINKAATDAKLETQNSKLEGPLSKKEEKPENDVVKTTPINKEVTDTKPETQNSKLDDPLSERSPLDSKKEEKAEKLSEIDEPVLEKQVKKTPPIIKPIKIGGYELGVSGGVAFFDGKDILRQNGFSTGIRSGMLLGDHLKIVGEAQYLALSYEVNKLTGELDIPIINPPTANDEFHEVRVEQPYWQYALGLQYTFGNKRLKPYIGTSLVGQAKLEEKFEYQFQNQVTREDVFVTTKRHDDTFQLPIMRLNVGAEYPIWRKIQGQIEGSYDVKVNNIPQFKPLWQVKAAVLYRF